MGGESPEDAGGEGGGKRTILFITAHSNELVHGAAREPAARQCPVDGGDAERQHPMHRRCRPLDAPNSFTKRWKKIAGHAGDNHYVYVLF